MSASLAPISVEHVSQQSLHSSWRRAAILVAPYVLPALVAAVWRFEIIDSPPYWDHAMGLFMQADFLAKTDFDYSALMQEPYTHAGGANYLPESLGPPIVAALMKLLPSPHAVLVAFHLLGFAACGMVIGSLYRLIEPTIGAWGAALTAACCLSLPLFIVQVDLVGLDLPMTAMATWAALAAVQRRYFTAAIAGLLAYLFKSTGAIATMGIICYLLAMAISQRVAPASMPRQRLGRPLLGQFVTLALIALIHTQSTFIDRAEEYFQLHGADEPPGLSDVLQICPDLLGLLLVGAGGTLWLFVRRYRGDRVAGSPLARLAAIVVTEQALLLSWALAIGSFLACLWLVKILLPRYILLSAPFLACIWGRVWFQTGPRSLVGTGACLALIALSLFNSHGRLMAPIETGEGAALERTLEYLPHHQRNIAAMRLLDVKFPGRPVVVVRPYEYFLALPSLGYVKQSRSGYTLHPTTLPGFQTVSKLLSDLPRDLIFVHINNALVNDLAKIPPPGQGDREIAHYDLSPSLILYDKPSSFYDQPKAVQQDWYASHVLLNPILLRRAFEEVGRGTDAVTSIRQVVAAHPDEPRFRFLLATMLARENQNNEALRLVAEVLLDTPEDVAANTLANQLLFKQSAPDDVFAFIRRGAEKYPDHPEFRLRLGVALAQRRRFDESIFQINQVLALNPSPEIADICRQVLAQLPPSR